MSKNHKHEYSHVEEGTLTVTSSGEVEVKLDFVPDFVDVSFADHEHHHGCCDVSCPDTLEAAFEGKRKFEIVWNIKSTRVIKWVAKKIRA